MSSSDRVIQIHPSDNVGVALAPLNAGEIIKYNGQDVSIAEDIPAGHKVSLREIPLNCNVIKYGYPIGHSLNHIPSGYWVHTQNLRTNLSGQLDYEYLPAPILPRAYNDDLPNSYLGYLRDDGQVGIRNEIWIINTVGCINKVAERLAERGHRRLSGDGIDGVYHFPHPYGCSQLGDDLQYTQKALAGLARHPNAAGILVIGLGCENNRLEYFLPTLGENITDRVSFLSLQETEDEFEEGMKRLDQLARYARKFKRQELPVSTLKIGLKCGGSDGFSGLTANPLVGRVADLIVERGGTALLTEVPEMFGAETILMNRAKDKETFEKVVDLVNNFKAYYERHGQVIYENPSPGNKDGGITTLEEKSLGCTQKGGTSVVERVLSYGEESVGSGLQLLESPGNDMVSVTALSASGAHVVLFTTGRGTPMGGAVPTVKVSTNTDLAQRKPHWIDFDAGRLLSGEDLNSLAEELYIKVLDIASGNYQTRNEENSYREISIFKDGVTL